MDYHEFFKQNRIMNFEKYLKTYIDKESYEILDYADIYTKPSKSHRFISTDTNRFNDLTEDWEHSKRVLRKEFDSNWLDDFVKPRFEITFNWYKENPISYKLNQQLFRSDEFSTEEPGNVFLGCSDTFGVGHNLEHTWPYVLTELAFKGDKIYNLAVPGSGPDTAFRLLDFYKNKLNIKNIFHWLPFRLRYEYYIGDDSGKRPGYVKVKKNNKEYQYQYGFQTIVPHLEESGSIFADEFIKNGLTSDTFLAINYLKNIRAIKSIADELGVNYHVMNFDTSVEKNDYMREVSEYFTKNNVPHHLLARDFSHSVLADYKKVMAMFLESHKRNLHL